MSTLHESLSRDGLVRPLEGRVLGGVCAGLGRRFGIDPWPARLLFVLVLMVVPGSQILIYPILWILMPSQSRAPYPYAYPGRTAFASPATPTAQAAPAQQAASGPVPPATTASAAAAGPTQPPAQPA